MLKLASVAGLLLVFLIAGVSPVHAQENLCGELQSLIQRELAAPSTENQLTTRELAQGTFDALQCPSSSRPVCRRPADAPALPDGATASSANVMEAGSAAYAEWGHSMRAALECERDEVGHLRLLDLAYETRIVEYNSVVERFNAALETSNDRSTPVPAMVTNIPLAGQFHSGTSLAPSYCGDVALWPASGNAQFRTWAAGAPSVLDCRREEVSALRTFSARRRTMATAYNDGVAQLSAFIRAWEAEVGEWNARNPLKP